ncbi:MAG: TetR/AcrR family transcriptional regulator [Thermoleophilaceae bacterium]|nr:TetR/AcrR family transcriptional regulator [Thermoleophilaceae bacterium]
MSADPTRRRLLDAAAAVVRRDGPRGLTLDAVAAQAGLSKGGLLYHFTTKDALIDALVQDWLDRFEAEVAEGTTGANWACAYARACAGPRSAAERATDVALLVAIAAQPRGLEAVRKRYAAWQDRLVADARDQVDATVVRLAADGLWFADLLGLAPPTGQLRQAVTARLEELGGR